MKSQAKSFDDLPVVHIPTVIVESFTVSGIRHFASLDGGAASREAHWYAADLRSAYGPEATITVTPQGRNDWSEFVFAVNVAEAPRAA